MEQKPYMQPHVQEKTKKNSKLLKIIPWLGLVLFIITIASGSYLFATRQLAFALGASDEKPVASLTAVCGKDIIQKYNDIFTTDSDTEYASVLKTAYDAVGAKPGYASDPNCVFIRYTYYFNLKDTVNARKELDQLKILAAQNLYATSALVGVQSIDGLEISLNLLNQPAEQTNGGDGEG